MAFKANSTIVQSSLVLLVAFGIYNAINYAFHFSMARLLTVADYGVLAVLYSLLYIFGVLSESIQTVVVKYASSQKGDGKLKSLLRKSMRKGIMFATLLFVIYIPVASILAYLLEIPYLLVLLNGVLIFLMTLLPINRGILQGRQRFKALGASMVTESILKVIFALALVYIGWRVYGAVLATILAMIGSLVLSWSLLGSVRKSKEQNADTIGIYDYSQPVIVLMFCIFLFYSLDIIIARMVFDPDTAGMYAIASTIGKVIFLGTQPISRALFPISAASANSKAKNREFLKNAVILLLACVFVALIALMLFPEFLVKLFSGKTLVSAHEIVLFTGIGAGLLSITNLVLLYRISRSKIKGYWFFLSFIVIEVVLLLTFSDSLVQFSLAWVTSAAIFLWGAIFLTSE